MNTTTPPFQRCDVVRVTAEPLTGAKAVVMRFWTGEPIFADVAVIGQMITVTIPVADLELVTPASDQCSRLLHPDIEGVPGEER